MLGSASRGALRDNSFHGLWLQFYVCHLIAKWHCSTAADLYTLALVSQRIQESHFLFEFGFVGSLLAGISTNRTVGYHIGLRGDLVTSPQDG